MSAPAIIQGPDWHYPIFTQGRRYRLLTAGRLGFAGGFLDGAVIAEVLVEMKLVGSVSCQTSWGVRLELADGSLKDVRWDDIKDGREI